MRARASLIACALAPVLLGCGVLPFGEVSVVVDTDVRVPERVDRLRVDVYTAGALDAAGAWYESADFAARSPDEWPLSFSLATDGVTPRRAWVRLRAYRQGELRDYVGEHAEPVPAFVEPTVAATLNVACTDAPLLPPGTVLTQRRGEEPITPILETAECVAQVRSGVTVARVEIPTAGRYRFEVVSSYPDGSEGFLGGNTILYLRSSCLDVGSQLACNDDLDPAGGNELSRLVVDLAPGSYYLMSSSNDPRVAGDVSLRWTEESRWLESELPTPVPAPDGLPRLVRDGIDVTPASEPKPALAIDRVIELEVVPGERRTARVLLTGECLGLHADLRDGRSCIDGNLAPIAASPTTPGLESPGTSVAASWERALELGCTVSPRVPSDGPEGPLFDEEVCVPGGVFELGSERFGELGPSSPTQIVVVEPFLMDRYELSVGRFYEAYEQGWRPTGSAANSGLCTLQREANLPLNCIDWVAARELCQFLGGDLPSSAQWEYAAIAASRAGAEATFPWGEEPVSCDRAITAGDDKGARCTRDMAGPQPLDAAPWVETDVNPLGLVGLGGNLSEYALDASRSYTDPCWHQHRLREVGCSETMPPLRVVRGSNWQVESVTADGSTPISHWQRVPHVSVGFRCVRKGR